MFKTKQQQHTDITGSISQFVASLFSVMGDESDEEKNEDDVLIL